MNEEERRKELATQIADTIQHILRDSEELSELLEQAHHEGYAVLLSIFSGVVVRRKETDDEEPAAEDESSPDNHVPLPEEFEFTEQDRAFLKSIGIHVTE